MCALLSKAQVTHPEVLENYLNISVLYVVQPSWRIMSTTCESVVRYLLPLYRAFVAKELIEKYDYTQVEVAKKLGTTQAAISQYVTSKRGHGRIPNYEETATLVQNAATKVAERITTAEMSPEEFSASFCGLCASLRQTKKIP
jgi:predicted transcriptional regulator